MTALYWIRSDMRISDNLTLARCLEQNQDIIFVFSMTKSLKRAGHFRRKFMSDCFNSFKSELEDRGFTVLATEYCFPDFISTFFQTRTFNSIYCTQEYSWEERQEELLVQEFCKKNDISLQSFDQGTLIAHNDLPFSLENMPFVFTDFRKKIELELNIKPIIPAPFSHVQNLGMMRLNHYIWKTHAVQTYKESRNGMLRFDDSTKLSPWLNAGLLSPRTVYHELKKYENEVCENDSTYWLFFELLWRDYFKFFSLKYGHRIFMTKGLSSSYYSHQNDTKNFEAWCTGKTSDSFINACMNELNQTGWMSNRGRQNVASFLIHDLGINWTWGASYFEEKLFDYDPDLNWGNWLYLSGRGSDPRARKFNTIKQAEIYDPQGEYRQFWRSPNEYP